MSIHRLDPDSLFAQAVDRVRAGADAAADARGILDELTPDERLWLLDGDGEFWSSMGEMSQAYNTRPIVMGEVARVGLPGLRFSDGPRGVVMGNSTAFPVSMARGATWNVDLEERIGTAIGVEMRAQGANLFAGVCINLPRHPGVGARAGDVLRRPAGARRDGCRADPWRPAARDGGRQAFRAQLDGERALLGRCHRRRRSAARGVPAALPSHGRGGRGRDHVRVQLRQRRVGRPERGAAHRCPA